jgi:hypothetical protein
MMAWGFQQLAGVFTRPKAGLGFTEPSRIRAGDPEDSHVLPEIVHDTQSNNQGLWLTVGIFVVVLAAGGGFFVGRATVPTQAPASAADDADSYDDSTAPSTPAASTTTPTQAAQEAPRHRSYSHAGEAQGAAVIAAAKPASGMMYVHRMNSDLRDQPSYDAQVLKKEAKGAQVQLLALSDKWAQVKDGTMKGWMRTSVLKDTPPGEKCRKKDDSGT